MAEIESLAATSGRPKACSACGAPFVCHTDAAPGGCWCNEMPVLLTVDPAADCMCRACLSAAVARQSA